MAERTVTKPGGPPHTESSGRSTSTSGPDRPDYERFGNGYDVRVTSSGSAVVHLPLTVQADVTRSATLPTRGYIGPVTGPDAFSSAERAFVPLFQVGRNVAGDPPVRLEQRDGRFDTDRACGRP